MGARYKGEKEGGGCRSEEEKKERVKRGRKVRKRMRRTGGKEVFKLLIATGRNTMSSKREKTERERQRDRRSRETEVLEERKRGSPGELH